MTHAVESDRASTRSVPRGLVPGAVAAVLTTTVGSVNGGYFPTSWGWTGLALAWIVLLVLLLRASAAPTLLGLVMLTALSLFVGWVALSALWSVDAPQTMLEVERDVVYVVGVAAVLLARRVRPVLGGVLTGIVLLCLYALATRLLPDRVGAFDPVAVYRLSSPVGYWNALAIFAAMGVLLALGIAVETRRAGVRVLVSVVLVVLAPTIYFTFSRGGWLALVVGAVVLLALHPQRLRLLATSLALLPAPAIAIAFAWRAPALRTDSPRLVQAAHEGHRLALIYLLLVVAAALAAAAFGALEGRLTVTSRLERGFTAFLVALTVLVVAVGLARFGSPLTISRHAWDAFAAEPNESADLNQRLFSFSGNGRVPQWRVAVDEWRAHRLLGTGAGTYEQYWYLLRPRPGKVRDVHNLYLEVWAELGPLGLTLLAGAFAVPFVAAARARRKPLVAAATAAYAAYLVHAAVDWDWEMVVVTLTALVCGAAVINATGELRVRAARLPLFGAAGAVVVVAFVGLVGNIQQSAAASALRAGDWGAAARHAERAHTWAPWASEPYRLLGEARLAQGKFVAARAAFHAGIRRDRRGWELWFDLARATTGPAQRSALARASALNPRSTEVAEFRDELRNGWALLDEIRA